MLQCIAIEQRNCQSSKFGSEKIVMSLSSLSPTVVRLTTGAKKANQRFDRRWSSQQGPPYALWDQARSLGGGGIGNRGTCRCRTRSSFMLFPPLQINDVRKI
jgi:hypothetical protein